MATPTITFQVNLGVSSNELIGTDSSKQTTGVLSPDRNQSTSAIAIASMAQRVTLREAYIPGGNAGENRAVKHGDTIVATGKHALYLRDTYGIGFTPALSRAILTVVSVVN